MPFWCEYSIQALDEFFSQTTISGEDFEPKHIQGSHPFWVYQANQMAKITIFNQKTALAETSTTVIHPQNVHPGNGEAKQFSAQTKKLVIYLKKKFMVLNSFWGTGASL